MDDEMIRQRVREFANQAGETGEEFAARVQARARLAGTTGAEALAGAESGAKRLRELPRPEQP
ncbi:hypothetical protein E0H26_11650 [Micromonospora zingiberis]|uniref:Uncharacterized protein n=1 Tax=Micromonospora zingiberis TaxID=2053011 RepID=A0A4R0GJY6_9ACTN|nr:hypothetical protein [Micromonospora zingiberis]TCB97566.1 hypothetical protein E0H26_11650 [Micromonospora zingiberis]